MTTQNLNFSILEVIKTNDFLSFDWAIIECTDIEKNRRNTARYLLAYQLKSDESIHLDNFISRYFEHGWSLPTITLAHARQSAAKNIDYKCGIFNKMERNKGNKSLMQTLHFKHQELMNEFYERTGLFLYA
jgi:hypothetical protein